jgi:hypothetical protein
VPSSSEKGIGIQINQLLSNKPALKLISTMAQIAEAQGLVDYNILQNNGAIAHQAVFHVHVHVIPKPDVSQGAAPIHPSVMMSVGCIVHSTVLWLGSALRVRYFAVHDSDEILQWCCFERLCATEFSGRHKARHASLKQFKRAAQKGENSDMKSRQTTVVNASLDELLLAYESQLRRAGGHLEPALTQQGGAPGDGARAGQQAEMSACLVCFGWCLVLNYRLMCTSLDRILGLHDKFRRK